MLSLNMSAKLVLADSGGLQEECTILGTPCLTLPWEHRTTDYFNKIRWSEYSCR